MTDTTKSSGKHIPDGIYFVQPDGCAWYAVEFCDGQEVGRCEESDAETHRAARDRWAGVCPSEADELLDVSEPDISVAVALACGHDDAYGISVSRRAGE